MLKKNKNENQLDVQNQQIINTLSAECTTNMSMNEFQKLWNQKHKEKITEMVKLNDVILVRFGNKTVRFNTENLYL